ncbi:WD repeat-containing protein 87 [Kappamyces sp. JEL0829]|nr:WD repeat-containing protein 87 [Kappamyces sp. JEL0829]
MAGSRPASPERDPSPASRITSASTRSRADSDDESYARSSASHDSNLIQPWNYVKTVIQKTVGSKAVEVAGSQDGETKSMVPITLSHGFQPIRTMENLKPGIRGVHYLPGSSMFVSLDKEWLSLWKGGTRIQRIPAIPPPPSTTKTLEVKKSIEGLYGFSKWVYIETLRIYVVASQQLELKVLNSTFGTVSVTSTPKPVLCMEFIHATGMLVLGEIEGLRILSIKRTTTGHVEMIDLVEHRAIAFPDEWISCVLYDARRHALFAGCGSSLYVFDYESGSKIDSYYGIHDLSITQLAYYEPSEYLITGAKDGTIKIWNVRKSLLFDFHEHYSAITGFMLLETACGASWGSLPILVSSSLDATIRMWNFENGQSIYRIETGLPCLGLNLIKKNIFYHYTESSIQLWNVNRYQYTYSSVLSRTTILKRVQYKHCARIIAATADGSIRLISPLSGSILGTGFPTDREFQLAEVEFDFEKETLYCLNSNGSIVVYDCKVNPFQIMFLWNNSKLAHREVITCLCGADLYNNDKPAVDLEKRVCNRGELMVRFLLFGGTDSGQIHQINIGQKERQSSLVQAHSAKITMLYYDAKLGRLVSGAMDGAIKVWELTIDNKKPSGIANDAKNQILFCARLRLLHTLTLDRFDSPPSLGFSLCPETATLGLHCQGELFLASYGSSRILKPPHAEPQEVAKVQQVVCNPTGTLWAASYDDCTVKVWDAKMVLIRDIQFHDHISSVCFANDRGDLLVGLSTEINLVRIQDYMTPPFLRQLLAVDFADDQEEMPLTFDQHLDFWSYEKDEPETQAASTQLDEDIQKIIEKNQVKHVAAEMNFDELVELSKTRRMEASLRRHRREFLELEKDLYQKEVMKKKIEEHNKILAEFQARRRESQMVEEHIQQRLVESEDLVKIQIKRGMSISRSEEEPDHAFDPKSRSRRGSNKVRRMKAILDRTKTRRGKMMDHAKDDSKPQRRGSLVPGPKKKHSIVRHKSLLDDDSDDEVSNLIVETNEFTEEPEASQLSDEDLDAVHFFPMGDEENEGYHKDLIEASAKELEMFMEIQALDLEKRRAASQTVEKPHQVYIDGMALPNSSGIAEILPVRRGSKELVKSDKLFQKQQLSQLYVLPGQANHDDDADLIPRFDFRNRLQSSQPELEVERAPTPPPEPEPVVVETIETKVELEEIASPSPAPVVVPPQKYNPMYDWRADDSDSEVESPPPAVAAPVPKAVKTKKPKRFRPGQPNIDLDDIVSNDGEPRSRGIFGDEATKKLIKIHGVEELPHPAAKHAKKKKEKKKVAPKRQEAAASVPLLKTVVEEKPTIVSDVDALVEEPQPLSLAEASVTPPQSAKKQKTREPLFEPRRFVKLPEAIPMPRIPPKIIKSTSKLNRPDFKLSERVVRAMSLRSSDEPFELKKSFPKGQLQHSSLDSVSIETVKPILSVLTNASASLSQPITIDSISAIVTNQFKSKDSTKITEAIQALVSLHTMFKDDVKEKKQFDTFVAPMLDAYLSDDVVIRHQVVRSLVDMEIRHDDVLALLICALNERDHTLVQTAIKGLANYGVADKEGLKRAMIELGMIHGKAKYTSNEKLEQLADKIQRDATKQQMERLSMTSNWIKENDLPALTLTRHDSYFEHLAGPFFPPDAHDFDGKQRYLVLATESNVNYDQYWKEKYMAKLHQDESSIEVFKWDENSSRRHTLSRASHLTEMIQIRQMISTMLPGKKGKQTPRTNASGPHASQKAKSSAHMALAITRAMARGLVPNELQASSFPKLRPVTSHNSRASDASIPLLVVPMQHGKPALRRPHTTANAGSGTLL